MSASVWDVIRGLVSAAEEPEVRRVVGEARIERCDALRAECEALREIVQLYLDGNSSSSAPEPARAAPDTAAASKLLLGGGPERELLERKITMLLEYLGEGGASTRCVTFFLLTTCFSDDDARGRFPVSFTTIHTKLRRPRP